MTSTLSADDDIVGVETATGLVPVDRLDVVVLVENMVDILAADRGAARRHPLTADTFERAPLRAEHGLSLLVTVHSDGDAATLLYDVGLSPDAVVHNADVLGVDLTGIRLLVLSHGHADHTGGLEAVLERIDRRVPCLFHPDALRIRRAAYPDGRELRHTVLDSDAMDAWGGVAVQRRGPSLVLEGRVLVTGEVPRTTAFETGHPLQQALIDGKWQPDPLIRDDQALVVNVKGRGLVVLSACSHAGAVNIMRAATTLTGTDGVHAVIGGLHLTGGHFRPIIDATIDELAALQPDLVAAGHCTGWDAQHRLAAALPDASMQNLVGTTYVFERATP